MSGTYVVNKGVNKEQASLYINQFRSDSAFIYLTYMSGAPEFETESIKGFVVVHDHEGWFSDSGHSFRLVFANTSIRLVQNTPSAAHPEIFTKYRRLSNQCKRSSTMYIDFSERQANAKLDSLDLFEVPNVNGKILFTVGRQEELKIVDSFGSFYLVETHDHNKEFLWAQKKYINLKKTK